MDDLVRRKDVIDALRGIAHRFEDPEDWCILEGEAEFVVSKLPSAQPVDKDINVPCTDVIDRQAAICIASVYCHTANIAKELAKLPSAQPEREKGNWVYGEDEYGIDGYHCDKCGFFVPWDYGHAFINYIEDYNFCPSCGADMREEGK